MTIALDADSSFSRPLDARAVLSTAPDQWIDVGHSRLPHRTFGTGPDVLFVHGWPLHGATFRGMLPRLARSFRCHVIDLPGAGESEWDEKTPIQLMAHIDTVERVVDSLGLEKYAMVAHDSGALITRYLAERHSDRVTGLVMGNTEIPGHHAWQLKLLAALVHMPFGAQMLNAVLRNRTLRKSRLGYGDCFEDRSLLDGEFAEIFIRPGLESKKAMIGTLRLLDEFDWEWIDHLETVHGNLKAPTLLVWGANDPFFPMRKAKAMLPQFSAGAELVAIPGAKLFAHEEKPEAFAEPTASFLEKCFADRG